MSTSCLKIISCGTPDAVDNDDRLESSPQDKSGTNKRGWSFRKRSVRHHVLNNTVITEAPPSGIKDSPEPAAIDFQRQPSSAIADKTPGTELTEEKSKLSTSLSAKLSEVIAAKQDVKEADASPDESVAIVIQAAIRAFLAQKLLLKHKNIIKLQAAVRGHLVRRHAVGTLRCVQAIVKMQALVRARRARVLAEGSNVVEKPDVNHEKDIVSTPKEKDISGTKLHFTNTSIEKLLSNRFARQLLESTPKTANITIKCDPSKSDSAWNWLERWMSVSSKGNESLSDTINQEDRKVEHVSIQEENSLPSESNCRSADMKASAEASESDENLSTYDTDRFDVQACRPTSPSVIHNQEQFEPHNTSETQSEDINSDTLLAQKKELELFCSREPNSIPDETDAKGEWCSQFAERITAEQQETERKKFLSGSQKASNPAFLAAQSKFEELSSAANSAKSARSTNQEMEAESYADTVSSFTDHSSRKMEGGQAENFVASSSKVQVPGSDVLRAQFGGSECGTELSITSTLDSPERFEVGGNEYEKGGKILQDSHEHPQSKENVVVKPKIESATFNSDVYNSDAIFLERNNNVGAVDDDIDSVVSEDLPKAEQKPDADASELMEEPKNEKGHQVCKSSPEASPRSHITAPEQGTPSSEISVNPKRMKGGKSGSTRKLKSSSAGRRSPSSMNHDSGARSSIEQLPKDHKSGKRRNSFGSPKPDHVDQVARDSSSSNPLPSYMQTTESARAKALANSSPRSSPDVQDREVFIKKRHSLPGANGRHESPQIQRTMSQPQQIVKANGTQSPQEKKWRR